MDRPQKPGVNVVISTRDRGDRVVTTILGILSCDYPRFDVTIVDQSRDERTRTSLRPLLDDPRLRYVRTSSRGLSRGLNLGIELTEDPLIAVTGDDCEVPKDWLAELVAAFELDPRIGIVFGNVLPGPHDRVRGFVPGYVRDSDELVRSLREKHRTGGTSACMGLKRSLWKALGGFDPLLGAGARFHSAEDTDLSLRALSSGYRVREAPSVHVIHHGFYPWEEHSSVVHRYWYGTGAAFGKRLKQDQWSTMVVLARLAFNWASSKSRIADSISGRPHRLLGGMAFARGAVSGVLTPIDGSPGHFRPRKRRRERPKRPLD